MLGGDVTQMNTSCSYISLSLSLSFTYHLYIHFLEAIKEHTTPFSTKEHICARTGCASCGTSAAVAADVAADVASAAPAASAAAPVTAASAWEAETPDLRHRVADAQLEELGPGK